MSSFKKTFAIGLSCIFLFLPNLPVRAGVPTEQIKQTTEKIIAVLKDPALQGPAKTEERNKKIRSVADERFDWEEMARRTLGKYWNQRTAEEKKTFVPLFVTLLERTYLEKVKGYSGEKVIYGAEKIDEKYCQLDVRILTDKGQEVAVSYKMKIKNGEWMIYDIVAEGVSLVNNYRVQFDAVLSKSPFSELIKKLEEKIAKPQQPSP